MPRPIGILGGTFDPVHKGHLHLATTLLEQLELAELRLIPLNQSAHKTPPLASTQQRLKMLQIATADHAKIKVDDCEIQRGGTSYTIDTLELLRQELPQTPLCLIMGTDNFNNLHHWRQWQSLLDHSHIVIVARPNHEQQIDNQKLQQLMEYASICETAQLHQYPKGHILESTAPMLNISATQIRNDLCNGMKVGSLLADKVLDFINNNHLYR